MLALTLAGLQWYGPGMAATVQAGTGIAGAEIRGTARAASVQAGAGAVPLAKPTRLKNSPCIIPASGTMVQALPKARARMGEIVKIGVLSQDDVTGAVLEAPLEGSMTVKQALRILLAHAAGDATGLDGNPAFKSLDGSVTRVAGTITGDTRTITTRNGS